MNRENTWTWIQLGLLTLLVAPIAMGQPSTTAFVPGHIYTPADEGVIVEWDEQLGFVRSFSYGPRGSTATGATFNDAGNLDLITRLQDTVRVLEVDANGQILRNYDTGSGSLLRGSYIEFDPIRRRYVFADDLWVTVLDSNLAFVASSAALFDRASGVAIADDGRIFVTDQFEPFISELSPSLELQRQIPFTSSVPTGMARAENGQLLVTSFGGGSVFKVDPVSGDRQTIISGLGFGGVSDVERLADGRLLTINSSVRLQLYTSTGSLIASSTSMGTGDGLAVFVPEPGLSSLCAVFIFALSRRNPRPPNANVWHAPGMQD